MKIFVAGATGRVAKMLIEELVSKGHDVLAGARNPEKMLPHPHVTPVFLDVTQSVDALARLLEEVDAIYFTAGSRGKALLQVDAFGAVQLMQAAQKQGVRRFIMLSSLFATQPEKWREFQMDALFDYNIAKFFADEWLITQTNLDYTIVQPSALVEAEKGSGKISINVTQPGINTIPNVAKVLAEVLENPNTIGKIIQMSDGEVPISEALQKIE